MNTVNSTNHDVTRNDPHKIISKNLPSNFPSIDNMYTCLSENGCEHLFKNIIGSNRESEKKCQIKAKNDIDATLCWLREYQHKQTTYRTYKKAAERLLLWCLYKHNKPLSSLDRDDFEAFSDFLSDPQPRSFWCSNKKVKREHPDWRPLQGPLCDSAKQTVLLSIRSLMNYLVEARYLSANPMGLIKKISKSKNGQNEINQAVEQNLMLHNRVLEQDEWDALIDTLNEIPETTITEKNHKARLRFIIAILGYLGLRISELATHQWNAFFRKDETWWMLVYGKGDKLRTIAINNHFFTELIRYRRHFGLTAFPDSDDKRPILVSIRGENYNFTGISAKSIRNIVKNLSLMASEKFKDQPSKAQKLRKFSPHWLRHTCASMQYYAGVNPQHTQENLGHSSLEMTAYYQHSLDKLRHEDMMKFKLRIR